MSWALALASVMPICSGGAVASIPLDLDPRVSETSEDIQALGRVSLYLELLRAPIESVQLVVEETERRNPTPTEVQRVIAEYADGQLPPEDYEQVFANVQMAMEQPKTVRFVLAYDRDGRYHYERLEDAIRLADLNAVTSVRSGQLWIQGADRNWSVDHADRSVTIRRGQRSPEQMTALLASGWGECEKYLGWPFMARLLESIRGVRSSTRRGTSVLSVVALAESSPLSANTVYLRFDPQNQQALFESVVIANPLKGAITRFDLNDWTDRGGLRRPLAIVMRQWLGVDLEEGSDIELAMGATPYKEVKSAALQLRFNERVNADFFMYFPREDYEVFEEQDDGHLVLVYVPGIGDPRIAPPRRPSARQREIRERLERARAPSRQLFYLGSAGGALVIVAAILIVMRKLS